ncbi:MAG TPA: zinc-dependent metalloprotease [Thermoleophilaceae bacterium]|nr:zinc-dependent metalloprotease [Thermoleophilaceae bacterium]
MVDWTLARQVARLAAGSGGESDPGFDVAASCAEMAPHVERYTGLSPATPAPAPEVVERAEWAAGALDSLAVMLDPVAARLDDRLAFAGPLAGALRAGAAATLAAEAGLVLGYISQRVLGQYDVSLLGGEAPPRLVFVSPNLAKAVRELEVDAGAFGRWVCAHELTHVHQFQGVPWLREHMSALLRRYLETVDVRIERGSAGGLPSMPDLGRLVERFRDGGLAALVQSGEQRGMMAEIQAAMAVIEGYSEHVMDEIAREAIPGHEPLRAAMERRRRSRSAPERLLERLLGFDLKLRQYELGKRFCDAVAERGGIERLNGVWASPEALPTPAELEDPGAWLERTGRGSPAAA